MSLKLSIQKKKVFFSKGHFLLLLVGEFIDQKVFSGIFWNFYQDFGRKKKNGRKVLVRNVTMTADL
jgi:hypothetical protein